MKAARKVYSKGKKPYKSWLKDGVHGGPCSMDILVEWLAYKPNYKRWKREDYSIDRVPKKDLLEEIIDKLRQVGIYHRLSKDIASKISTLQSNYRITQKWLDTQGYKLKYQPGGHQLLHDELIKRFPYWDILDPAFRPHHDRHSSMAITNIVLPEHRNPSDEDMLYYLEQKYQDFEKERLLVKHEKYQVEREFIHCLYKAGFAPNEVVYYICK